VLLAVLRFVPLEDLINVSRVCRRLARVVQDVSLWPWSRWAGSYTTTSDLMESIARRNQEAPIESRLLVGIVGARQCGKSTLINQGIGAPWCDRVFGSVYPKATLYEHGSFGGVGDLEFDHYGMLPSDQRPWNVIAVCFDAQSRTSWHTAQEWLAALSAINAARRLQVAAVRAEFRAAHPTPEMHDTLFCPQMHQLEHLQNVTHTHWYRSVIGNGNVPGCAACNAYLMPSGISSLLVCADCDYTVCEQCAGASAVAAAKNRDLAIDQELPAALRPLRMFLLANARTPTVDGALGELEHDSSLLAEAEQGAKQSGATFMMFDFASRSSTDAFVRRLLFVVVEQLAASYLRQRNVVNERIALRERAFSHADGRHGVSAPYAELPIDPSVASTAGADSDVRHNDNGDNYEDDYDNNGDDDDVNGDGKARAVATQPTAEAQAMVVRALLQRQLRGERLNDGRSMHARARITGAMACTRGHALVRTAFMPQPHIDATVGSLFKVCVLSAVAPLTVDGLTLAADDVIDVLELPNGRGGLALGALNGVVGRFPMDVCRPVTRELRDLEALAQSRKCKHCFWQFAKSAPALACLQCHEFVCRKCAGDLAFALAQRSDWASVTSATRFIAESVRDIADDRRREPVLDVPLTGVVMVLRDSATGQHSRPVVTLCSDNDTVWPESRAVLCAARDGRVGWLPLLALDSASQSVGTASLRWRIAAAFHRNVCLIRATSGCPSPTDLKDENAVVGEYFACHTCAALVVCGVCRTRCHAGHQLQPLFAPPATTLCACGAGRAPGATAPPCCALHEEGIEPVLPTRSVRVVSPIVAPSGAFFFAGQILDVVENAAPRNGFRAVRDPLVFTGVSYVTVGSVVAMMHPFPSDNCVLFARPTGH
jgi:hypothetical protein